MNNGAARKRLFESKPILAYEKLKNRGLIIINKIVLAISLTAHVLTDNHHSFKDNWNLKIIIQQAEGQDRNFWLRHCCDQTYWHTPDLEYINVWLHLAVGILLDGFIISTGVLTKMPRVNNLFINHGNWSTVKYAYDW